MRGKGRVGGSQVGESGSASGGMYWCLCLLEVIKLVPYKFLGPEPMPVSRQSAVSPSGDIVVNPAVGCRHFSPGPRLPSQPQSVTALWPIASYAAC